MFRATIILSFGIQSHCLFSIRRSEPDLQFQRLEPLSLLILAFRATISAQFQRLEPPSLLILAFKATISTQFGVQSHHPFSVWLSEPPSLFNLAFRVTSSFGTQSHYLSSSLVLRATSFISAFRVTSLV
ncbi:hypothetical protein VitviT2T_030634 [Vitis vinifera]|uniref:Uncharacterized protein n=1 Tax=Vitis vinifera TaxID=29760 RepID=A0ABY9E046_VITVI|nr:hypothetical protein VitviT2T_030634 [Vitis vinifera]